MQSPVKTFSLKEVKNKTNKKTKNKRYIKSKGWHILFLVYLFVCLFFFAGRHFPPRFPQIFKNNALKILINTNIYVRRAREKKRYADRSICVVWYVT